MIARVTLSVVVVAHDSLAELRRSLPALTAQLSPDDELVVVDNASCDGLAGELPHLAARARLVSLDDNVGFAEGANRGADQADGDLLVLLNPDAVVQPGWADAIRMPWGSTWAAWMGLVLLDDGNSINTSGGVLHFTGFGWAGQLGQPAASAPAVPTDVGFLSGACLAIPRTTWQATGGFAEHFFMYCEDVDLSLKLRLAGGRLAVIPDARVTHEYEFAKGASKWRYLERNRWATIIRTFPTPLLAVIAPALVIAEAAVWAMAVRGGWGRMKALATLEVIRGLPRLLAERRAIQAHRRVPVSSFAAALTADLSSPYLGSIATRGLVRSALAAYWRLAQALLR